jgi:hypothetical protein
LAKIRSEGLALLLLSGRVMRTHTSVPRRAEAETVCLIRWVLQRGGEILTCQVDAHVHRSAYDVCIVPHWDVDAASIEVIATPSRAFQRHAEIAMRLRNAGWFVAARSSPASC